MSLELAAKVISKFEVFLGAELSLSGFLCRRRRRHHRRRHWRRTESQLLLVQRGEELRCGGGPRHEHGLTDKKARLATSVTTRGA
jgi:hypothetical protein